MRLFPPYFHDTPNQGCCNMRLSRQSCLRPTSNLSAYSDVFLWKVNPSNSLSFCLFFIDYFLSEDEYMQCCHSNSQCRANLLFDCLNSTKTAHLAVIHLTSPCSVMSRNSLNVTIWSYECTFSALPVLLSCVRFYRYSLSYHCTLSAHCILCILNVVIWSCECILNADPSFNISGIASLPSSSLPFFVSSSESSFFFRLFVLILSLLSL